MKYYRNLSGISQVHAYEIGDDSITVQMDSEAITRYTYASVGKASVERMKALAAEGSGLNRYIQTHLGNRIELLSLDTSRTMRLQI